MKRILSASEKQQIEMVVGRLHVSTTDDELKTIMVDKLRKAVKLDPTILAPVQAYALKTHHANQDLFRKYRF